MGLVLYESPGTLGRTIRLLPTKRGFIPPSWDARDSFRSTDEEWSMANEELAADLRPDDSALPATGTPDAPHDDAAPDLDDAGETDSHTAGADRADEPAPLEPNGTRFKQVWARAKSAESKLHEEREARARVEGELSALKATPQTPVETKADPRLTWAQLQAGIEDGRISQAQAFDYRDETIKKEMEAKFDTKLKQDRETRDRGTTVHTELSQYRTLLPESVTPGTPERKKVEAAFLDLVQLGYDHMDPRTELLAARQAFGSVSLLKERQAAKSIPQERDTMQDIAAAGKPKPDAKDPLKTISSDQRKHYQRMIDRGMYKGWSEVREELQFVPPR